MDAGELEGVARFELERVGFDDGPVDAFDLAHELRIPVEWTAGSIALRIGERAIVPASVRPARLHGLLTHEIAHILLARYGLPNTERNARYLGAALLVSRRILDRQLRAGWNLHELMAYHVNASAELLARRIMDLRHGSLAIYDGGRLHYRIGRAAPRERALVDEVLEHECAVRVDDLHGAWPVMDGRWRRVIVLAAA